MIETVRFDTLIFIMKTYHKKQIHKKNKLIVACLITLFILKRRWKKKHEGLDLPFQQFRSTEKQFEAINYFFEKNNALNGWLRFNGDDCIINLSIKD